MVTERSRLANISQRLRDRYAQRSFPPPAQEATLPGKRLDLSKVRRTAQVMAELRKLPSLPSVVAEVISLANSPHSVVGDFEKSLSTDPGLTARVLQLANCPLYRRKSEIRTVSHAVSLLGHGTIRSVVLASALGNLLRRPLISYGYEAKGLWNHSMASAWACRKFAQQVSSIDENRVEELFVIGLLHDLGKLGLEPVLCNYREEWTQALENYIAEDIVLAEREVVGIDHPEAAVRLIATWDLGDDFTQPIANHHLPVEHEDPVSQTFHLAECWVHSLGIGLLPGTPCREGLGEEAFDSLGIPHSELDSWAEELQATLSEMAAS